ncbi:transaldolase [Longilinea arvoryzae]|uniref:Transaldolase n=1 Tax=Longilinea arvoryzae TaxID=360412 RepID=A0A0S7BE84_9CHLR|nr:transaldolase [Longilinea arvoryzae]GAP12328.1 transaldolase [Longilinea arvoryzae]
MKENPLLTLEAFGQSIWMDYISRGMVTSGELRKLIEDDGVSGVTSNPSIFEKAIAQSHDYDEAIRAFSIKAMTAAEIYQYLTVEDIQNVADLLRPTYDRTGSGDGFVSLEVSPRLAHDTAGTIAEASHLWSTVNRPNVMIKVPATPQGIPAIQHLIGEGVNINITLLFGLPRYREVVDAYLGGLETLAARGKPLRQAASVASFFLSRIDVLVEPQFEKEISAGGPRAIIAARLHGQAAIASAKIAYEIYKDLFSSARFKSLEKLGARPQRLLWASTSTKNPAYSDTKYVEALIGPDTINTLPIETITAYRDHGHPEQTLDLNVADAGQNLKDLAQVGIDLDAVTQQLEDQGVEKFISAFDQLMASLEEKRAVMHKQP